MSADAGNGDERQFTAVRAYLAKIDAENLSPRDPEQKLKSALLKLREQQSILLGTTEGVPDRELLLRECGQRVERIQAVLKAADEQGGLSVQVTPPSRRSLHSPRSNPDDVLLHSPSHNTTATPTHPVNLSTTSSSLPAAALPSLPSNANGGTASAAVHHTHASNGSSSQLSPATGLSGSGSGSPNQRDRGGSSGLVGDDDKERDYTRHSQDSVSDPDEPDESRQSVSERRSPRRVDSGGGSDHARRNSGGRNGGERRAPRVGLEIGKGHGGGGGGGAGAAHHGHMSGDAVMISHTTSHSSTSGGAKTPDARERARTVGASSLGGDKSFNDFMDQQRLLEAEKKRKELEAQSVITRWGEVREADTSRHKVEKKDAKRRQQEVQRDQEREMKWLSMWSPSKREWLSKDTKLRKRRIRKGVPDSLRAQVWPSLTGADKRGALPEHKGVYQANLAKTSPYEETIIRDLTRTFPNHVFFRDDEAAPGISPETSAQYGINTSSPTAASSSSSSASSSSSSSASSSSLAAAAAAALSNGEKAAGGSRGRASLYNVLIAYSNYDTVVGYLQGMGFVVGIFLMYLSEEESFWMLEALMRSDKFNIAGLYSAGFPLLYQYFYTQKQLVLEYSPKLHNHMMASMPAVEPEMYATQWFITLYSYNFPFDVVLRIYDIFLSEGVKFIFRISLYLHMHLKDRMLKEDFQGMVELLKQIHKDPVMDDPDQFISTVLKVKLTAKRLQKLEKKYNQEKFANSIAATGGANSSAAGKQKKNKSVSEPATVRH